MTHEKIEEEFNIWFAQQQHGIPNYTFIDKLNAKVDWLSARLEKAEKGLKEASRLWFEIPYGYYPDNDEGDHFEDCERGLTRLLKNFNQE